VLNDVNITTFPGLQADRVNTRHALHTAAGGSF
jgi:hypothetical protein